MKCWIKVEYTSTGRAGVYYVRRERVGKQGHRVLQRFFVAEAMIGWKKRRPFFSIDRLGERCAFREAVRVREAMEAEVQARRTAKLPERRRSRNLRNCAYRSRHAARINASRALRRKAAKEGI